MSFSVLNKLLSGTSPACKTSFLPFTFVLSLGETRGFFLLGEKEGSCPYPGAISWKSGRLTWPPARLTVNDYGVEVPTFHHGKGKAYPIMATQSEYFGGVYSTEPVPTSQVISTVLTASSVLHTLLMITRPASEHR